MKSAKYVLGAILFTMLVAPAVFAISLCQYTQPITSVTTSSLQVNLRYLEDEYRDDRGNLLSLTLAGSFLRYYDSVDFGYGINANGSLSNTNGNWALLGAGSVNFRFYAPGTDLFAFGRVNSQWAELTPTVAVILGAGYGRLRDVTPLAKAVRISDKLLTEKLLKKPVPDDTLMSIAQEIGKREEYASLDDLVVKVVQLIEASGATVGKLGADAVLYIRQIITATGDTRLCGFSVNAGVGYKVLDPVGARDFVLFGSAEYSIPWSVDTQLHMRVDGTSVPNFTSYGVQGVVTLIHKLTPTTTLNGNLTIARTLPAGGTAVNSQSLDATLSFTLFEGWAVNVTLGMRNITGYEEPRIELTVSAGITF
ncbi:MAG: hypothetical protein NZ651_04780 [Candidatus Bipolaricaulota bacterium]|nr:hypothetical protein [Candidatus Bipolaricaulota bacterium]MDW8127068.1 hypothetical protein [Candidatus Bipolaricaulota bacterium]